MLLSETPIIIFILSRNVNPKTRRQKFKLEIVFNFEPSTTLWYYIRDDKTWAATQLISSDAA